MKRLTLILFDLLAALSLLLCVLAIWVRPRSYSAFYKAGHQTTTSQFIVGASSGEFCLIRSHDRAPRDQRDPGSPAWGVWTAPEEDLLASAIHGFPDSHPPIMAFFIGRDLRLRGSAFEILLPVEVVIVTLAIAPLLAFRSHEIRRRRRRRVLAGHCPA